MTSISLQITDTTQILEKTISEKAISEKAISKKAISKKAISKKKKAVQNPEDHVSASSYRKFLKKSQTVLKTTIKMAFNTAVKSKFQKTTLQKNISGIIELIIVNDREMREMNRRYRGKSESTDVISFSYLEGDQFPGRNRIIGEIYISIITASRQALQHRHSLEDELSLLLVHGLLHIFGYDHERSDRDAAIMRDLEQKILGKSMIE